MLDSHYDFVLIGAGITGLATCRELKSKYPDSSILVLDKEKHLAMHSSGRNSGVLHSGIYYQEESLKAKFCAEGMMLMKEYCLENSLPLSDIGKVIVPTSQENDAQIELLYKRAKKNNAIVELIDKKRLKELEPFVQSASNRALYSPHTAVVDPKAIVAHLKSSLQKAGVTFLCGAEKLRYRSSDSEIALQNYKIKYKHLFNTAGQNSNLIAQNFELAQEYTVLPFKGIYYKLNPDSKIKLKRLVYPVPDMNVPFLGVHTVQSISGQTYFGPTAVPAFGRENYHGIEGLNIVESLKIFFRIAEQYYYNNQNFRNYTHAEAGRYFKSRFAEAAKALIPELKTNDLISCDKVGIRAQLLNIKTHELVMDFCVKNKENSTHVLNVVSPGFTSAFSFAKYIVKQSEA